MTLVLTSHVLEIVEKLCPLIAILDQGRRRDLGSLDELRQRHSHQGSLGHVLSAGLPRDLEGRALGPAPGFTSMLASAAANALVVALLWLGLRVGRGAGPWGLAPAMWGLCGVAALVYWRVLPLLGERVMALREQLIDELG